MPEFMGQTYDLVRVFMGQSVSPGIPVTLATLAPPKNFDWLKLRATKLPGTSDF